ncbi:MAG: Ig-like domain-containing protein [Bacteroidota bacterium]|nr:Ig-like domain-containing protein [Bacteroidota bacterium]
MKKVFIAAIGFLFFSCSKSSSPTPNPGTFTLQSYTVNGEYKGNSYANLKNITLRFIFTGGTIDKTTVSPSVSLNTFANQNIPINVSYDNDSTFIVTPNSNLTPLTGYRFAITTALKSQQKASLKDPVAINLYTSIDSTDKFPQISDSALLTFVEQQTLKYFYDFGHPVSGLARERNSSADVVTTGGSGFGVMALIVGVQRNFITRAQALSRIDTIVNFLTTKAQRYHGAFPHWMNGATGATVPFSPNDNGADLVETSYMMQGLLTARQFFNTSDPAEIALRAAINNLWNGVEWNWFRQGGQNVLYWHWSPTLNFVINQPINGWDEAMIVYALAASSTIDSNRIPKIVYDNGWALNGNIKNGKSFFGITLPLGPDYGGPLFFAHYSFLGINPNGMTDAYADYMLQNQNHSLINYNYCVTDPQQFNGYSSACWGLTASDEQNGYSAHSPTNDDGVITPTAAISSLPYTPVQSMNALRFFYYKLGDKTWGSYGFKDAFNLTNVWFADSYLAIDQGPEIIMIENYRSGLLWNLFMSCPEIKTGMKSLGFQSPNLN